MDVVTVGAVGALVVVGAACVRRARLTTRLHRQLAPVVEAHEHGAPDADVRLEALRAALTTQSARLEAATELCEIGAWPAARALLDDVEQRGASRRSVRYRLARLRLLTGARLAEPGLTEALATWMRQHPRDRAMAIERAGYALEHGELSELLAWLPDWVDAHDDLSIAHSLLGRARYRQGELTAARRHLERACALRIDLERRPAELGGAPSDRHTEDQGYLAQIAASQPVADP